MIDDLLERIVKDNIKIMGLTDKMISFLVKKKKRGTYQAMNESQEMEKDITDKVVQYIKEWMINETLDGSIKKALVKEVQSQVELELSSKGFDKISVN